MKTKVILSMVFIVLGLLTITAESGGSSCKKDKRIEY